MRTRMLFQLMITLTAILSLGCSKTVVINQDLFLSTIVFADGPNVTKMIGSGVYTNSVSGEGDGAITYSSRTPATATVNKNTGEVTLVAPGTTIITANKAETATYATVVASYTLTVTDKTVSTIIFSGGYEISKMLGSDVFTNPVSGEGDGTITYSSGTPATATVNENTGEVTFVAGGTTIITAHKAETPTHAAAIASYTITVHATYLPVLNITTNDNTPIINKEDWIKGKIKLFDNGSITDLGDHEIKGRGNSTWGMPKKPYTFKLENKKSILGMESHKRWVLLANYSDKSLLRTTFAFDLGISVYDNLKWTPNNRMVEVVLNDEYIGVYQLVEQIRVDKNRVDIDLDNGDFLMEVNARLDEKYNFKTTRGVPFSFKDPEEPSQSQFNTIKLKLQEIEDIIYSDGFSDVDNGYTKYIDLESFIDWYLINEFTKNNDAIFFSSVYMFYKDDLLYMGPLWDFDISSGNIDYNDCDKTYGYHVRNALWISRLFEDPTFSQKVKDRWNDKKDVLISKIDGISNQAEALSSAADNNFQRWDILGTYVWPNRIVTGSYDREVIELSNWLRNRYTWMDKEINK